MVIEALEYGVPCIAWDIPGVSEDVEDGITGRTIPFGDHTAVADAIQQTLNQPADRERFSSGARERFAQFSIDEYADHFLDAYDNRQRVIAKA